jgi:5-methylcytosine-specific restriction endonuclease McrA
MAKVLVLNASYEPLNITSWRRAVVLLIKGKAEPLEQTAHEVYPGIPLPSVIRLRHYVRVPYVEIALTTCQYCRKSGEDMTLDHVIPRSRGGQDTWENIVVACVRCNVHKGSRTPKEAEMPLLKKPSRPHSSLYFEVHKYLKNGTNQEWRKYVIGAG